MKKYIALIVIASLSTLCVFGQQAVIREMNGTVEVRTSGNSAWTSASRGMVIDKSASISTGFRSNAVLVIGESVITVKALTRLTLEELFRQQGDEKVTVGMQTGRIRTQVTPPSGGKTDFTVRGPSATASVRGTEFDFDTVNLSVISGQVNLRKSTSRSVMPVRNSEKSTVNEIKAVFSSPRKEAVSKIAVRQLPGLEKKTVTLPTVKFKRSNLGLSIDW